MSTGEKTENFDTEERKRTLTQKGKTYQADLKIKDFRKSVTGWRSQATKVHDLLDSDDQRDLKREREYLKIALDNVNVNYKAMEPALEEVERSGEFDGMFEQIQRDHYEIMKECRSEYSGRSKSRASSRSSRMKEQAAHAAAKAAELKIKAKYIEEEMRRKTELELVQLKKEAEIEEAKAKALSEADEQDRLFDFKDEFVSEVFPNGMSRDPVISIQPRVNQDFHQDTAQYNIAPTSAIPSPHYDQNPSGVDIVKAFADKVDLNRLPPPEPEVFMGNVLSYPIWKNAFDVLIGNRAISSNEKIYYLRRYLGGKAKEAVEGYLLLNTEDAYQEARALLDERFGDDYVMGNAFKDKLESWPKIKYNDGEGLRKFTDFLRQCNAAKLHISGLSILDDDRQNRQILQKLPDWIIQRWSRIVNDSRERRQGFPKFTVFVNFMQKESSIACEPVTSFLRSKAPDDKPKRGPAATVHATDCKPETKVCLLCKEGSHHLDTCKAFLSKSLDERRSYVKENSLCFGCLKKGHRSIVCRNRCSCKQCGKKHPTSLHDDRPRLPTQQSKSSVVQGTTTSESNKASSDVTAVSHLGTGNRGQKSSMILPVWVSHIDNPEEEHLMYALLDTQSDHTYVTEEVCDKLGISGVDTTLSLSTLCSADKMIRSQRVANIQIRGYALHKRIKLPPAYSRESIPANREHIPSPEMAYSWPHLRRIASHIPSVQKCPIGLLVGYNCSQALIPRDVLVSTNENHPYGQLTDLGWSIVGIVGQNAPMTDEIGFSHRVIAKALKSEVIQQTKVKEVLGHEILAMMNQDFQEHKHQETFSVEDQRFLNIMSDGIHQLPDRHYEMPLPFKQEPPKLPNNRILARRRLLGQKSRFSRNEAYKQDYVAYMGKIISDGYAERVSEEQSPGPTWYIPHHGVYHPKKPTKIRVVFDCSSKYMNESLNDHLLSGPDMTNALIGVLIRFRQEFVAVTCDIEAMFHQFKVAKVHRDYLRFLWWQDNDFEREPVDYRMTVHLFGAVSSPACATYALRHGAAQEKAEFGEKAYNFIYRNFYVDDGLMSVPTEAEALQLMEDTKRMCNASGLRLHKFLTNSCKVLESIPEEDRASKKNVMLLPQEPQIERALGVQWCFESDCLTFRITLQDKPLTRRGVLSTVASIYDPLGLIAPVTLIGKKILQEMCRVNTDWDDPLPDNLRPAWERWRQEIPELATLQIPRCYKAQNMKKPVKVELHHFSDASTEAYGQCSYLRYIDDRGLVHCSLILGKARVAPLKAISIPRLELTAAVVSVNVHEYLNRELELEIDNEYFWTDSTTTLAYIKNESRRFHVFVANRVQRIREATKPDQWNHIKGSENPADFASRGIRPNELSWDHRWFQGPRFLSEQEGTTSSEQLVVLEEDDPELKKVKNFSARADPIEDFDLKCLEYFSCWYKAKRAVAHCMLLKERLLAKVRSRASGDPVTPIRTKLSTEDLVLAEREIIKHLQKQTFPEEVKALSTSVSENSKELKQQLRSTSSIHRLDPMLDKKGILRVGGRLKRCDLSWEVKHPVIVPRKHHISELLVRYFHEKTQHQGRGMTTNEIRANGFWITGCSSAVSQAISKCVTCRRHRSQVQQQKMADLPEDRLDPAPPFTYSGVDLFGPWYIKDGRKELKRYGVIFTCLVSRAIHLETANSLDTNSFINALRRFMAIRGPMRVLRSDRGTNFIGARRELKEAISEMKDEKIRSFLLEQGCDFEWRMNPPAASHFAGVWERQIRSVRSVLTALMDGSGTQLDDESLRTFFHEAAAIVNSRPLTIEQIHDPHAEEPLTPNHLLTMKTKILLPPPGNFQLEDLYSRKRWRRIQYLANEFWHRWKKEYVHNLQVRKKWQTPRRNSKIGDIVLLKEDNSPRCVWRLAKVIEAYQSKDGLVRSVKLEIGDCSLSSTGKRISEKTMLDRPVDKIVLLLESEEEDETEEIPVEEPH